MAEQIRIGAGYANINIGYSALQGITSGNSNITIGTYKPATVTTPNVAIGRATMPPLGPCKNAIAFAVAGYMASNSIAIGYSASTTPYCQSHMSVIAHKKICLEALLF